MNGFEDFTDRSAEAAPRTPRYTSFSEAFDTARHDAGSMAREAAPKLKEALAGSEMADLRRRYDAAAGL